MRSSPAIGTPVRADLKRNCLFCNRYTLCKDERKSGSFACSRFKENNQFDIEKLLDSLDSASKAQDITDNDIIEDSLLVEDFVKRMDEVLSVNLPVVPDLRHDDRHIKKARNVFDWMTNPEFLGLEEIQPYPKQLQMVCHTQADWCPHCSNEDFFEDFPLEASYEEIKENVVFLNHGVCPECKVTKYDLLYGNNNKRVESYADPFGMISVVGQRAGKTTILALHESYVFHKYLMTPSPHKVYGIMRSTPMIATYVAMTFAQAKLNIWQPIAGFIDNSPWFRNYHKWLDEEGRKIGEELYNVSETMLRYKHKNIMASIASPSKRVLRGATRFSTAVDELGWYPIGKTKQGGEHERLDGKEVVTALTNSLSTIKGAYLKRMRQGYFDLPKPTFSAVSSPAALNDAIMQQYRNHIGHKEYYCIKYATWEVNPNLPRETFNANFRIDPIGAERDYGANPPVTTGAFFTKEKEVFEIFDSKSNRVDLRQKNIRSKKGSILSSAFIKKLVESHQIRTNSILCIDPGLNNNSFALCVASLDKKDPSLLRIFAMGEVIPKKEAPVSFSDVFNNILVPLVEKYSIKYIFSDRWQNIKLMQDLENQKGVYYQEVRLKYSDFISYKEDINEGNVSIAKLTMGLEDIMQVTAESYPDVFKNKPVDHCFYQHITVVDSGNTVSKGIITDDLFRCCVLANSARKYDFVEEALLEESTVYSRSNTVSIVGGLSKGLQVSSSGKSAVSMKVSIRK